MTSPPLDRLPSAHLAWLKEISVALHRRAAYPTGHPTRLASDAAALDALRRAFEAFPEITLAVGARRLTIGTTHSDPRNPALADLAEKMHRRGISVVTFRRGLTSEALDRFLTGVLNVSEVGAVTWEQHDPHLVVEELAFDALALADPSEFDDDDDAGLDAHGERLWHQLSQLSIRHWDGVDGDGVAGGRTEDLVAGITAVASDPTQATAVLESLIRVGRYQRKRGRRGSGQVAARVREVVSQLPDGVMRQLLAAEPDPHRRLQLIKHGIDALPVSCVVDFVEAAAQSSGQHISEHLLRLFGKLSQQTRRKSDQGPDDGGQAIRDAARELVEGWGLDEVNPAAHASLLEQLARFDSTVRPVDGGDAAGADRILQMALELDAIGPDIIAAADDLVDERRLSLLLSLIARRPESRRTGPALRAHLSSPDLIRRILLTEPVEYDAARELIAACDATIAPAMLDAIAVSESQATRQLILARLREFDDAVRPELVRRLDADAPWQITRNLLHLLAFASAEPTDLVLDPFAHHPQPMVRLEALRLRVRIPALRDAALLDALSDADPRVVRTGVELLADDVPRRVAPRLLALLQDADAGSELRIKGLPLLAAHPSPAARELLLGLVSRRRGIMRRVVLQPKGLEMLAALRALAAGWKTDPLCSDVLALAREDADASIRDAARGVGAPTS
jgi:hypothetical protein